MQDVVEAEDEEDEAEQDTGDQNSNLHEGSPGGDVA
jgi:hypothetical protein